MTPFLAVRRRRTLPVRLLKTLMIAARSTLTMTVLLAVGLLFSACGSREKPIIETPSSQYNLTVVPGRNDVRSEVNFQDDRLYIDIYSESGIGSADILFPTQNQPADIYLRMHLSGLEQLQLAYDGLVVAASVASMPPYQVRQSVILKEEGELEIESSSPYWMSITIVSGDEDVPATIPLKDGYFEAGLTEDILNGDYEEISVNWIDFYR